MSFSTQKTDEGATLRIAGQLDAVTAPDLWPLINDLLIDRHRRVVVDATDLRMIDSYGVRGLVTLYKKVNAYGGVVTIHGLSNQPAVVLKLLQLDQVLQKS